MTTILGDRRAARLAVLAAGLALALGGCDDTRKILGMDKTVPDEFRIVSRAPLTMPPDYALRPPQPGAVRPQEGTTRDAARSSLLEAGGARGANGDLAAVGGVSAPVSPGEEALLKQAGGNRADPGIRARLDRESAQLADADSYLLDRLIFWRRPEASGDIVDAPREAQRLRENAALGKPANAGDTPTIQRRQRGLLEGLF